MKRMVDELVGSEATYDADFLDTPTRDEVPRPPPTPPSYSFDDSPFDKPDDHTTYGLLGNNHGYDFPEDDSPDHAQLSTPRFSSLYTFPMASYHGETASRPSTAHRVSSQQQDDHDTRPNFVSPHNAPFPSSITVLSATARPYEAYGQPRLSIGTRYAPNGEPSTIYGNDGALTESHFLSPLVFDESLRAFGGRTPPNGQAGG